MVSLPFLTTDYNNTEMLTDLLGSQLKKLHRRNINEGLKDVNIPIKGPVAGVFAK